MQAVHTQGYEEDAGLYMAMELSNRSWKLAFSNGVKTRRRSMPARDRARLLEEVQHAKQRLGVAAAGRVVVCYEAGRDGHWIYHWLTAEGFTVWEIDSSSIETARGRKHVKTDRVDVVKLLDLLLRYAHGYRKAFSVVRVPSAEAEAAQRLHREDEYLVRQRARVSNRLQGLLVAQGLTEAPLKGDFLGWLQRVRLWDGQALSAPLQDELGRLYQEYALLNAQLAQLVAGYQAEWCSDSPVALKRRPLERLKGIGPKTSRVLSAEVFSWRRFRNGKEVGGMSGLTPTPSRSGDSEREQGISKAGNRRVRRVMIEAAWFWLQWQPDSALSQWYERRFGHGSKRLRRIGIVALARKLLIALWRYVEWGVLPEGAVLKAA
jgi:transposase